MSKPSYRILIAPACFKGSLSAHQVAALVHGFLAERLPENILLDCCPVADGGDDTLAVLQGADSGFQAYEANITGPIAGFKTQAHYLYHAARKMVVIEAAQAHGLTLLPGGELRPLQATSYGVGELIRQAVHTCDPETLVITVGGSASTDGGMGALQALGVEFLDKQDRLIQEPLCGGNLKQVHRVVWPRREMFHGQLLIATDVVNPLLGKTGAAAVFAPQKGATPKQCAELEKGLAHIHRLIVRACGTDCATLPGAGAAGGLAYGLRLLPRSGIVSGSNWVAGQLGLGRRIEAADLVITGEGRLDATSFQGKATGNILVWADQKPVFFFCGQVANHLSQLADVSVFPLVRADDPADVLQAAMENPTAALARQLEAAWPRWQALLP